MDHGGTVETVIGDGGKVPVNEGARLCAPVSGGNQGRPLSRLFQIALEKKTTRHEQRKEDPFARTPIRSAELFAYFN
jgi:hypothetical protein